MNEAPRKLGVRILVAIAVIVLAGSAGYLLRWCQDSGGGAADKYYLSGTLSVTMDPDDPCDGEIPATVKVTVKASNSDNSNTKTEVVDSNGRFRIELVWDRSMGLPDSWIVSNVVRVDGSPICEHPTSMACPEGMKCVDVVSQHTRGGFDHSKKKALENDHWVVCGCREAS